MRRVLAVLLATATLAGCDVGGADKGPSESERAANTVRTFFLNSDPQLVCKQLSPRFQGGQKQRLTLKQIQRQCRDRLLIPQTTELKVRSKRADGDKARVEVELPGPETVVVNLEKIGRRWLIQSFGSQGA